MTGERRVIGTMLFNATPAEKAAIHAGLRAALEAGTLRPVIGRTLPMADAAAAHRALFEEKGAGKIILVPR